MALDRSDMADLTSAIRAGIRKGFDDYFASGRAGAGRGRTTIDPPPPPRTRLAGGGDREGLPDGQSPMVEALKIPEGVIDAQANQVMNKIMTVGAQIINLNKAAFDNAANLQNNEMSAMTRGLIQTLGAGLKEVDDLASEVDFSGVTNEFTKSQMQIFASLI